MPSTYCLLSNGGLHFLPYHNSNSTDISLTRSDIGENTTGTKDSGQSMPLPSQSAFGIASSSSLPGMVPKDSSSRIFSTIFTSKARNQYPQQTSSIMGISSNSVASTVSSSCQSCVSNADWLVSGGKQDDYSLSKSRSTSPSVAKEVEKCCAHSIYLPDRYIEPTESSNQKLQVRQMLLEIFPEWGNNEDFIELHELTGGITNMLLKCTYKGPENVQNGYKTVLIRTYGRGTGLLIDRDREFVSHLVLNSYNLAPKVFARFGNGLVYGFIEGRALHFDELSNPSVYPFIASRLGQWHRTVRVKVIEEGLRRMRLEFRQSEKVEVSKKRPGNIWELIKGWIDILPQIEGLVAVCDKNQDLQQVRMDAKDPESIQLTLKQILSRELEWLASEIGDFSPQVAAHSDLLCGNIIIPSELSRELEEAGRNSKISARHLHFDTNPIAFIDYEYMMPGPRAFDISNHFQEWQGFACDKSLIPKPVRTNQLLRKWCTSYLQKEGSEVTEVMIDDLIDEISLYYGMPGFYWGIWAGIQSTISLIDFDYGGYSGKRLVEYWNWKRWYLKEKGSRLYKCLK